MRRKELLLVCGVAAVLLGSAAFVPAVVDARPAYEIPVHEAGDAQGLADATGEEWGRVVPVTLPLSSAASGLPAADNTTVQNVDIEAARTDSRLYLRLSWRDATRDNSTARVQSFADSVAVQFPVNESARPPIAMGSVSNRVNVWFWRAGSGPEELLAGGPGTTTPFNRTTVTTDATYTGGRWRVVLSRQLDAASPNRTTIPANRDLDVAVAVWNGSNMERSGRKAASNWYYLALGPGPQGAPYESILWAIAGLGIVVTTLVTIEGVRRTRGES